MASSSGLAAIPWSFLQLCRLRCVVWCQGALYSCKLVRDGAFQEELASQGMTIEVCLPDLRGEVEEEVVGDACRGLLPPLFW